MLGVALVLLAVAGSASAPHAPPVHTLSVVAEYPTALGAAADVRWAGDDSILVSDTDRGIGQATLPASGKVTVSWLPEWPPPTGPGLQPLHIALSGDRIVSGDWLFMLRWHARHGHESGQIPVYYIADLDLNGDRLLVSGMRRDPAGKMGMDGAMAWLGSLSAGEAGLKPILPFHSEDEIMRCAGFGLGVVRFLRTDGSFIVVPATEPGIFLFGSDGHLQRNWHTDAIGIEATCGLSQDQKRMFAQSPAARQEWVNHRAMIDEVIDTPDGPAVIIRSRGKEKTTWEMVVLNGDAGVRLALPFSSSSPWAHLSADTRGRRAIFLIADRLLDRDDGPPVHLVVRKDGAAPRLVLTEWSEH
jgi:hypothetical protein